MLELSTKDTNDSPKLQIQDSYIQGLYLEDSLKFSPLLPH